MNVIFTKSPSHSCPLQGTPSPYMCIGVSPDTKYPHHLVLQLQREDVVGIEAVVVVEVAVVGVVVVVVVVVVFQQGEQVAHILQGPV